MLSLSCLKTLYLLSTVFPVIALAYVASFTLGYFLERLRIPWVFAGLLVGLFLNLIGFRPTETINVLGELGMYLMLFIIGLEISTDDLMRGVGEYLKSTFFIVVGEALLGSLLLSILFGLPPMLAVLVAISFATVGEAVLIPILEEFHLVNTRLGKFIIGVGTLDDIIELMTLVWASLFITSSPIHSSILHIASLFLLFLLVFLVRLFKRLHLKLSYPKLGAGLPLLMFIFFIFITVGEAGSIEALSAILAGLSLRIFMHEYVRESVVEDVRAIAYGFFAPLFYLWVGTGTDMRVLLEYGGIALVIAIFTALIKIIATVVVTRKTLSLREALLGGLGLCTRFSTSLVVLKMLLEHGVITQRLFSVLVGSTVISTMVVPFAFAELIKAGYGRRN